MHPKVRTMENGSKENNSITRTACTECQRRKQKCNREWPCNHCQKRKVADKCRFNTVLDERASADRNHSVVQQNTHMYDVGENSDEDDDDEDDDYDADLEALGYSAAHFLSLGSTKPEKKSKAMAKQYFRDPADCSQLEHALQVLPPRPYTESLVQNFLNNVNFNYYIIHPDSFFQEYEQWWVDRFQNKPLGLPWTSLLLMVCACSAQYPTPDLKEKLERDLGTSLPKLSEKYHAAGRELYHTIPVGNSHLYTVQQLLHSCYWFKTEARYVDCWHAITAGIREAQELGIHQESIVSPASEFDREMRRRAWCLLTTWDWQVGSLLSRPLILDPNECDVQLPSLNLENFTPSPVLFMRLQAEIIRELSRLFGRPSNINTIVLAEQYKTTVEGWIQRLPQPFSFDKPDKSVDDSRPWVALHRHHIYTMSLSMVLDPLRPYLAKQLSRKSPPAELSLRRDGVKYALLLTMRLYEFFRFIYPKDARFHSVLFLIFDTAALLSSAILHDSDQSLPRREDCLKAIESSLNMLKRLQTVVASAKKPYEMLNRLQKRITKQTVTTSAPQRKRAKVAGSSSTTPNAVSNTHSSPVNYTSPVTHTSPASHTSSISHNSPGAQTSPGSYNPNPSSHHNSPGAYNSSGISPSPVDYSAMHSQMSNVMQPNHTWAGPMQSVQPGQSASPQYHFTTAGSGFIPSPPGATSGVDGSFILSTSPSDPMNTIPVTAAMQYPGVMITPEQQYQDFSFGNITEADLGALAGLWDYSSLNLENFVTPPYTGP